MRFKERTPPNLFTEDANVMCYIRNLGAAIEFLLNR